MCGLYVNARRSVSLKKSNSCYPFKNDIIKGDPSRGRLFYCIFTHFLISYATSKTALETLLKIGITCRSEPKKISSS